MARTPFDQARPRTPKGEAKLRERIVMDEMRALTAVADEAKFKELLASYGLKPEQPEYAAALAAWREAQASR